MGWAVLAGWTWWGAAVEIQGQKYLEFCGAEKACNLRELWVSHHQDILQLLGVQGCRSFVLPCSRKAQAGKKRKKPCGSWYLALNLGYNSETAGLDTRYRPLWDGKWIFCVLPGRWCLQGRSGQMSCQGSQGSAAQGKGRGNQTPPLNSLALTASRV